MTTPFTASNGIEIEIKGDGYLLGKGDHGSGPTYATAGPEGIVALREFFQQERDQELGRWRDPDNPNMVVYRRGDYATVLNELDTNRETFLRIDFDRDHANPDAYARTARRYFAAHPEPKPWEGAEPGEIWELTGAGGLKQLWVRTEREKWRSVHSPKTVYYDAKHATDGRRIWPEEGTTK